MALRDRLRVMVVDDMSTSRALVIQALDAIGIRNTSTAADGKTALASISQSPVHLVISDYNMPGMDGLNLLHALRENQSTKKIGFLLITGRADQQIIDTGRRMGMNNFLNKPFEPRDLRAAIEAIFGRL